MESYAVVDAATRKRMEDVLRTWKDPVPGSMDMRPVFSHELVRPIENALNKVRAASMPQQAIPGRPRPGMPVHRDTPTPPGMHPGGFQQPAQPMYGHPGQPVSATHHQTMHAMLRRAQQYPGRSPQPPNGPGPFQPPGYSMPPGSSVENLDIDIQNLIVATRAEAALKPQDATVQGRLRALHDLQGVMQSTRLPPDQLELIRAKVAELAAVTRPVQPPPQARVSATPPPSGAPMTLDGLLGQGALAALMARTGSNSQNSTPNPPPGANAMRSPPSTLPTLPIPAPGPPGGSNDTMALLDRLRLAGMLPPSTGGAPRATPPPPAAPPSIFPANLASILAMAKENAAAGGAGSLNSAILKKEYVLFTLYVIQCANSARFRPDVINKLYDDLGPPCTQCGRRFRTDEEGRKKKTAHMDWHFKVHQRSAEAEKRGTHRSWYVDLQDWLKSREVVDQDHQPAQQQAEAEAAKAPAGPVYMPVPDPTSGINTVCPICQEKFENKWLDTAQEWVWLDAKLVRNRAFHASCLAEATRDREQTPGRTPDPVLGKRKAESGYSPKGRHVRMY